MAEQVQIIHKRSGNIVKTDPRGWEKLQIIKDFLNKQDESAINTNRLEFWGEEGKDVRARVLDGLNSGGLGIFEGENYSISVGIPGQTLYEFNGYLDYSDDVEFTDCAGVKVALKKEDGYDWINEVADSFSYRYLQDEGFITHADFVRVPYVINYIPDNMQLLMLSISLFMMLKELYTAIKEIANISGDSTDAGTPVIGTSVGVGAGVVTAYDIGNYIMLALKIIAKIAYVVLIVIGIKNLIEEIIEQTYPKKRYHLGMSIFRMMQVCCEYKGLGFSSSLLEERKDWILIPSKDHKGGEPPEDYQGIWMETGVPGINDGTDTWGDTIRVFNEWLYADYRIINGVFHYERKDFWETESNYVIPNVFTNQKKLIDENKFNTDEIVANYNIHYAYDTQDQNTLDDQTERVFQAIQEPIVIQDQKKVALKGLQEIAIPFSLGKRKNSLTRVEERLKKLGEQVDELTAQLDDSSSFASAVESRKGSLLLSSHFLTIPKVVVMSGDKLAKAQRSKVGVNQLWIDLHSRSSFVEVNGNHNQWIRYKETRVPFCYEDYLELMESNYCRTQDNELALVEKISWNPRDDWAKISYRVKKKYTNNLKIKYL